MRVPALIVSTPFVVGSDDPCRALCVGHPSCRNPDDVSCVDNICTGSYWHKEHQEVAFRMSAPRLGESSLSCAKAEELNAAHAARVKQNKSRWTKRDMYKYGGIAGGSIFLSVKLIRTFCKLYYPSVPAAPLPPICDNFLKLHDAGSSVFKLTTDTATSIKKLIYTFGALKWVEDFYVDYVADDHRGSIIGEELDSSTRFTDVAGLKSSKLELTEILDFLRNPAKYTQNGSRLPKGILMVGPPGTGKTLLARAVAGEAGVPFYSVSGSDFFKFESRASDMIKDVFERARKTSPSIIFIDEIDSIGKRRNQGHNDALTNQLLIEMDGISRTAGVIVLAATNNYDALDPALVRAGRIDRTLNVGLPNQKERAEIFTMYLQQTKLDDQDKIKIYADRLAALTREISGAEISNLCNEAAILAVRRGSPVSWRDLEQAVEKIDNGLPMEVEIPQQDLESAAMHESGCAVAASVLKSRWSVAKISLLPMSDGSIGFTKYSISEGLVSKQTLLDDIALSLAGRAAEELFTGSVTTKGRNGLSLATELAQTMVTDHGMSDGLGLIVITKKNYDLFKNIIGTETQKIVNSQYERVKTILLENETKIHKLSSQLMENKILDFTQIAEIIGS